MRTRLTKEQNRTIIDISIIDMSWRLVHGKNISHAGVPVSYTHLDVYKRQVPGLQKAEFHMRFPEKERFGDCLLYTSHQDAVPHNGGADGFTGGVHPQNDHSCAPSMVMRRLVSPVETMSMRMARCSARREAAFSLHSAATTAPSSR